MDDGSRNERAGLVVMSYVAGFTAAFIAFGISYQHWNNVNISTTYKNISQTASLLPTDSQINPVSSEEVSGYKIDKTGLHYVTEAKDSTLLSLFAPNFTDTDNDVAVVQGIHDEIRVVGMSQSKRFLHFCEYRANWNECRPFMYDTRENVLRSITTTSPNRSINSEALKWDNNLLFDGQLRSVNDSQPWILN